MGSAENVVRDRVKRLFQFLREFHQIRHPIKRQVTEQPWSMWLQDLPDHPAVEVVDAAGRTVRQGRTSKEDQEIELGEAGAKSDQPILRVRRPQTTQAPRPPELLREWLERGWDDPFREVQVRPTLNEVIRDETVSEVESRVVHFADDAERVKAYESWKRTRDEWALGERPARQAMSVFEEFYDLYGRIQRESERLELVLGDGILSWRLPLGGVYHPVLLQRVQLQFDPAVPEFTVVEAEPAVELYTAALRLTENIEAGALAEVRRELEEGGYHPLGGDDTSGFLRRLVQTLSPRGRFEPQRRPSGESDDPVIGRSPVLFLRERTLGFQKAIDGILEDLADGAEVPEFIRSVVGVPAERDGEKGGANRAGEPDRASVLSEDPHDILFAKPWNQEQIQIADRLERSGAVVVQGPPGTGKTHTIANLIGHLLANGKSVLVTAHTTKALRVLRDHVVEPLRPLCVSVLESDLDSRRLLEESVHHIVERLSRFNADQLTREAGFLNQERRRIRERLRVLKERLLEARSAEYREVVVGGEAFAPAEAARKVARERAQHGWIPGPLESGAHLPLSPSELIELYGTNATVSAQDEKELGLTPPNPDELPKPEEYEGLLQTIAGLAGQDRGHRTDTWEGHSTISVQELEQACAAVEDARAALAGAEPWQLEAAWAGLKGMGYREPWERLLEAIKAAEEKAAEAAEWFARYNPRLPDGIPLEEQAVIVDAILGALSGGHRLSGLLVFAHPSWRRFIRGAQVGSRSPSTETEFRALKVTIDLELARVELFRRWDHLVGSAGGPRAQELGGRPEHAASQFARVIRRCLNWATERFEPVVRCLKACGFRWDAFLAEQPPDLRPQGELLRLLHALTELLPPILESRIAAVRWAHAEARLNALKRQLNEAVARAPLSDVVQQLRQAVATADHALYRLTYQRLVELYGLRQTLCRRNQLLAKLGVAAPTWASAIRERKDIHGGTSLPGDPAAAWLWRQLEQELHRRAAVSIQDLQDEITRLTDDLYDVTARLVEHLAWAAQIRRTTRTQQQALVGWLNTMRRIGAGYGKRVPRLLAEAAKAMAQARTAVPVWIMPLSRAADHFDPRTTKFDVVIIDEASQSDVTALAVLYLGKRVIVVGDNEQVSPDAVGEQVERVEPLISEYLQGIPNAHLYDGRRSVYDIAWESFGGGVVLLEHFRCVPEIIQFSNALSYNGRIKPLRESSQVQLKPHVVSYPVRGFAVGKVNRVEAVTVASLLVAASRLPEYAGKTFGVISLVGEEQALEIDRILRDPGVMPHDERERRRVLCGTPAQFQGDERDVVFLSMVDGPADGPLPMRQDNRFRQRFNVAASRARDQLWLVYSLDPQVDLKPGDLRRRLIEYVRDPQATMRALEREERKLQSEFEREVMRRLAARNYRVRAQWPVGYYRIDLVVEGGGKRLAIECDGDRYHPLDRLEEDMARQAVLERLGWRFVRIRGTDFFRDPDRAMEVVFDRLEQMGIPPEGEGPMITPATSLVEKVSLLAAELRREWSKGEEEEQHPDEQHTDERQAEKCPVGAGAKVGESTQELLGQHGPSILVVGFGDRQARGGLSKAVNTPAPPKPAAPAAVEATPAVRHGSPADTPGDSAEQLVAWVVSTAPALWFGMARWAKEKGFFQGWERKLLYSIGLYLSKGWTISPRQARQAKRLYDHAIGGGFQA